MKRPSIFGRVIAGLVLLAVLVGIGAMAYHAGTVNGLAQGAALPDGQMAVPYYAYGMRGHGFGFFGVLLGIFLFFLAFGALRRMIWGPRLWHAPGMHARWNQGVPPFFAEWHRQAHAEEEPQINTDEHR